jgi:hypothetical protein
MAFTGLRWGEVTGLQASYVSALPTSAATTTTSASNGNWSN